MVAVWSILLTATVLSGCVSEEPQSLTLPSVRFGDEVEYADVGERFHLTVGSSTLVLSGDLVVVDSVPLEMDIMGRADEDPPHEIVYHAGSEPAVGQAYSMGDDHWTYRPLGVRTYVALLPFHGFAGKTLGLGSSVSIQPVWFGSETVDEACDLTVDRIYREGGETWADATCQVSDRDVRFVFTEESPFPSRVETPRHELIQRDFAPGESELTFRDLAETALTMAPYGEDGPADGEGLEYSLAEATAAIRQGLETREARKCLEDRPDAVLHEAVLWVHSDGHSWRLRWHSPEGVCTGYFDSSHPVDEAGTQDETDSEPQEVASAPSEALVLADAFVLWDRIMDEDINYATFELDADGMLTYDIRGEEGIMVLDAGALQLDVISLPTSP